MRHHLDRHDAAALAKCRMHEKRCRFVPSTQVRRVYAASQLNVSGQPSRCDVTLQLCAVWTITHEDPPPLARRSAPLHHGRKRTNENVKSLVLRDAADAE